jgi:hypothetical protein
MDKEIPLQMSEEELLVRGIVHPLFYSNSDDALKREAFLPPPNKNDVSLLRHRYTNDDFCKKHSKSLKIGDNKYCGLATFLHFHIFNLNKLEDIEITAEIKATPIDCKNNYRTDTPIFIDDLGLPMHADLLYASPIIKGEPQTKHRKYAQKLSKIAYFIKDVNPLSEKWENEKICWKK